VNLKVGEATFQKIEVDDLAEHRMGYEEIEISQESAQAIKTLKGGGQTLLAVGTTSVRTLETWARLDCEPLNFGSEIFIYPGFEFKMVDRLLTNFHLPESSLFILVCAFAGIDLMQRAYAEAIREGYRFFSYGDAMLIL
jgi:S-adenosylmethionine:tRNA ribosyltransferase-isomerase